MKSDPARAAPDLQYVVYPLTYDTIGEPAHKFSAFTGAICLVRPESRGTIRIVSSDPATAPEIRLNYLRPERPKHWSSVAPASSSLMRPTPKRGNPPACRSIPIRIVLCTGRTAMAGRRYLDRAAPKRRSSTTAMLTIVNFPALVPAALLKLTAVMARQIAGRQPAWMTAGGRYRIRSWMNRP